MPRQARLILEGSCYHIINRGNGKETIFKDSDDLKKYLKLLIKYKAKYGFISALIFKIKKLNK